MTQSIPMQSGGSGVRTPFRNSEQAIAHKVLRNKDFFYAKIFIICPFTYTYSTVLLRTNSTLVTLLTLKKDSFDTIKKAKVLQALQMIGKLYTQNYIAQNWRL